jgi:hypothetical protein
MFALVAIKIFRDLSIAERYAPLRFNDKHLINSFFHSAQITVGIAEMWQQSYRLSLSLLYQSHDLRIGNVKAPSHSCQY